MRDRQQGKNERKLSKNKPTDSSKFRTAVRRELWVVWTVEKRCVFSWRIWKKHVRQTAAYNQTPVNQSIITINYETGTGKFVNIKTR